MICYQEKFPIEEKLVLLTGTRDIELRACHAHIDLQRQRTNYVNVDGGIDEPL